MSIDLQKQTRQKARHFRRFLRDDPHRPQYHYLPPANWLNDPNGLIQWNGAYHLFYQYNPNGAFHGSIHWGHAVSHNLVHWEEWPIALTPTPGDHDQDGCWSGCAINNDGVPTLFYSGVYPQVVCMATSGDDLLTWQKYPGNPIIAGPPPDIDCEGEFRDPFVWQEPDGWYMLMGTRSAAAGGVVLLYRSDDLVTWEYLHPLMRGDKTQTTPYRTGSIWECPNLVRLDDKHALIVSFQDHEAGRLLYAGYFVGEYKNRYFNPANQGLVDYGHSFYAPQVMTDEQDRRLMWGWLREGRSVAEQKKAGWSGVMSLPRVLSVADDDVLLMSPAPKLAALRGEELRWDNITIGPDTPNQLSTVHGDALEILLEVELQNATAIGLKLRCTPDEAEQTVVNYNVLRQNLTVDAAHSSLDPELQPEPVTVSHPLSRPNNLTLRVFIDRSVIELFADERICITSRVYPTQPDSTGLSLFAEKGSATIRRLSVWSMKSIWD
jgi:beta-fructofuranosidase